MSEQLSTEDYDYLWSAYEDAVAVRHGDPGGRHALLVMALNELGYFPKSWRRAKSLAEKLLWGGG